LSLSSPSTATISSTRALCCTIPLCGLGPSAFHWTVFSHHFHATNGVKYRGVGVEHLDLHVQIPPYRHASCG
ncbi:hypothetical protein C8R45DRAFT_1060327, partial [Mycena sanguinolenta]